MENEDKNERVVNPNWQFVGRLKDISVFNINDKTLFLVKTESTVFMAEIEVLQPLHLGQTVKFSKRDNTVRIGNQIVQRV